MPLPATTPAEYVAARFDVDHEAGCWLWTGSIDNQGYGRVKAGQYAHRFVYVEWVGPIPDGLVLDHLCRVRHCVNPDHPVTPPENTARGENFYAVNAAKTHCIHGHPFDASNTYVYVRSDGSVHRHCRACRDQAQRAAARRTSRKANA